MLFIVFSFLLDTFMLITWSMNIIISIQGNPHQYVYYLLVLAGIVKWGDEGSVGRDKEL